MLSEATFYGTIFVPIFQVFAEARGAAKRIWEILDSTVCSYNQHKKTLLKSVHIEKQFKKFGITFPSRI